MKPIALVVVNTRLRKSASGRLGEAADGEVDVEDPAPGEVVDEEAADQRPDHGRDPEDAAEVALVAAALARRDDVADDRDRRHHQASAAEPLEAAERDQLRHVLG